MTEKKSYPEELFELRLRRYRSKGRTRHPYQVELEVCERVNRLQKRGMKKPVISQRARSEGES